MVLWELRCVVAFVQRQTVTHARQATHAWGTRDAPELEEGEFIHA